MNFQEAYLKVCSLLSKKSATNDETEKENIQKEIDEIRALFSSE